MHDGPEIKTYLYSGPLKAACEGFVQEKRAVGCLYNTEAKKLSEFSRFTLAFDFPKDTLPKEVVQAWIAKKSTDSDRNQYARFSLISQFAKYMERVGYPAYVPGRDEIGKLHRNFVPYIFSHEEIRAFFEVADTMTCPPKSGAPRRRLIMPVLFRMLYCCGLRVSEATNLLASDVDLEHGILTIRNSKFGKTRYVPMSAELTAVCAVYAETRLVGPPGADWFFAAPDGGHYNTRSIYNIFRELLWKAGISHGGKGNGPRLHDFRHTFCVHSLQKWTMQGSDPTTLLPRLTAYLGHNDFSATEQYLRMTAEAYPEVSRLMEEKYGYIIPSMRAVQMKTTDFAQCLASYLTMYLPGQLGLSENTIMAYRDTFKLVLLFAETECRLRPEKITLADFNIDFIAAFLHWLEQERSCGVATRNQRLAALRAFARYARTQHPAYLFESQKIMDLKAKKAPAPTIAYLSPDDVQSIFSQTDISTKYGRRDMLLLSLMYDSGARVQEICDLRVRDVRLQKPSTVTLTGKGRKTRFVPIMASTASALTTYFSDNGLACPEKADQPLFTNHQRGKLTRAGVTYILKKYFDAARQTNPHLPTKISPHILRHSKAMHMLQAGINLIYIRDFLGHVHVETTEIYAKADTEMKRRAIESAHIQIDSDLPAWTDDKDLMALLTNLCGKN